MDITQATLLKRLSDINSQELEVRRTMENGTKLLDSLHGARLAIQELLKAEENPPPAPEADHAPA